MKFQSVVTIHWVSYLYGIIITFTILRLLSFLPEEYYFSFRFLFDKANNVARIDNYNIYVATVFRLAVPLVAGIVIRFLSPKATPNSIGLSTASTSFLLWWPAFLLWDYYQPLEYTPYKFAFLGLYTLYTISFYCMGLCGASVAQLVTRRPAAKVDAEAQPHSFARELIAALQPQALIVGILSSLATSGISQAMVKLVQPDY